MAGPLTGPARRPRAGRIVSALAAKLAVLAALTGCTLPDVTPFADATAQLRTAVMESGAVTAGAMAASHHPGDAKEFRTTWQDRLRLMDVLLAYSDSLASIVSAAQGASQSTATLGESIQRLADLVPAAQGAAVQAGVNLASVLINAGIQVKGYHDLAKAVEAADGALAQVAQYLQQDLTDLKLLYLKASQDTEADLDNRYGPRESQRTRLTEKRDAALQSFLASQSDDSAARLQTLDALVAATAAEHQEYVDARAAVLHQRATVLQMLDKAGQGVGAWRQAHADLQTAIRQKRQPNVRLILSTAAEIRAAVERLREAVS